MPSLDPAIKEVVTWENGHTDFPEGPLYWVDAGEYIELKAAGSVDKKDRNETVCKLKKTVHDNDVSEKPVDLPVAGVVRPELLSMPTAKDSVPLAAEETALLASNEESTAALAVPETLVTDANSEAVASTSTPAPSSEEKVVQDGEVIAASRPEPVTFVSAAENLNTLSLDEKLPTVNGTATGPHKTDAANLLDPAVVHPESTPVASA